MVSWIAAADIHFTVMSVVQCVCVFVVYNFDKHSALMRIERNMKWLTSSSKTYCECIE